MIHCGTGITSPQSPKARQSQHPPALADRWGPPPPGLTLSQMNSHHPHPTGLNWELSPAPPRPPASLSSLHGGCPGTASVTSSWGQQAPPCLPSNLCGALGVILLKTYQVTSPPPAQHLARSLPIHSAFKYHVPQDGAQGQALGRMSVKEKWNKMEWIAPGCPQTAQGPATALWGPAAHLGGGYDSSFFWSSYCRGAGLRAPPFPEPPDSSQDFCPFRPAEPGPELL